MYKVSYVDNATNTIAHKGTLKSVEEAMNWIKEQGERIKPLKLLVWDDNIDCYSIVKVFNTDYGTATSTLLFRKVCV